MLNVSYQNKIGHYTQKDHTSEGYKEYRIDICHANCLCALMYFFTDENGEKMSRVHGFFTDTKHLKKCIANSLFDNCDDFVFNSSEMSSEIWSMVKVLVGAGKKVNIHP